LLSSEEIRIIMQKKILEFILLGLSLVISSGCVRSESVTKTTDLFEGKILTKDDEPSQNIKEDNTNIKPDPLNIYFPVDPVFQSFYSFLGGREILGPAISPLEERGGISRQYVEAGLMEFDPNAIVSEQYQLAPLGLSLGVASQGTHLKTHGEDRVIDGHLIYSKFVPMYDKLGGARFVGRPITEARYDPENGRFLQYFENLGFYTLDSDAKRSVRLLAYGASSCDQTCRYKSPPESIVSRKPLLHEPFASLVDSIGLSFVGRTLNDPTYNSEGQTELIFDNLVLVEDRKDPNGVSVKPIVKMLGFQEKPLEVKQDNPLMVFYQVEGDKGYHVPVLFNTFLQSHGGLDISGLPLSSVFPLHEGGFRQCFENLCLDFDPNNSDDTQLKLAPLGVVYKNLLFREGEIPLSLDNFQIHVWERYPMAASHDPQEFFVAILDGGQPLKNREPILTLTLPGGSQETFRFPPTNEKGKTSLKIPSISAPNGTIIAYSVCLPSTGEEKHCVGDNFMVWMIH
jgi:hypothetical protein